MTEPLLKWSPMMAASSMHTHDQPTTFTLLIWMITRSIWGFHHNLCKRSVVSFLSLVGLAALCWPDCQRSAITKKPRRAADHRQVLSSISNRHISRLANLCLGPEPYLHGRHLILCFFLFPSLLPPFFPSVARHRNRPKQKQAMSFNRPIRGGCHCGRNLYMIQLPSDQPATQTAQILFHSHPSHRRPPFPPRTTT